VALVEQPVGTDTPRKLRWMKSRSDTTWSLSWAYHAKNRRLMFFCRDISITSWRPIDHSPGWRPPDPDRKVYELSESNNDGTGDKVLFTGPLWACQEYAQRIVNSGN
jgi:hypothetical protein